MALKDMNVVATGKIRQVAYDRLVNTTNLYAYQQGGKIPQEQFEEWLAIADALYSIGNVKVNDAFLDKAPKLKVIAQASVGYDNIDVEACHKRGIKVGNTPGVLVNAVADLAYGLILDTARSIARGDKHVKTGLWGERKALGFGVDLYGKTLGIVGMGDIGTGIAKRAQASGMKVIYHNRNRRQDDETLNTKYVTLDELLKESDFIVVAVTLNKSTENLFGDAEFAKMKSTARFVNISRGKVVNTESLYNALKSGVIAAAAIDVVEPEPIPGDHKLLTLDNITITPHIASSTVETRDAMALLTAENIVAALDGKEMPAEVK